MPKPVLTFKADGTAGGSDGMGATWTVDDARSPARLDFIHVVGRDAGKTQHCVYAVTGDTLTIVFSVPGQGVDGAPVRLDSSHKPMLMLMVLERASRDLR